MELNLWKHRVVGRPEKGEPFFVVRENSRNNSAWGPFVLDIKETDDERLRSITEELRANATRT